MQQPDRECLRKFLAPLSTPPRTMKSFGMSCVKYLVFLGNLLVFLIGAALLGFGVFAQALHGQTSVLSHGVVALPIVLMVLGAGVMLIAFFGCCGAHNENRPLLAIYFLIVLLLIGAQIGLGVVAYRHKGEIPNQLHNAWIKADNLTQNLTQYEFHCCGFWSPENETHLPCPANATEGCEPVLKEKLHKSLTIVEISALVAGSLQIFALIFAGCMICAIGEDKAEERSGLLAHSKAINRDIYA